MMPLIEHSSRKVHQLLSDPPAVTLLASIRLVNPPVGGGQQSPRLIQCQTAAVDILAQQVQRENVGKVDVEALPVTAYPDIKETAASRERHDGKNQLDLPRPLQVINGEAADGRVVESQKLCAHIGLEPYDERSGRDRNLWV